MGFWVEGLGFRFFFGFRVRGFEGFGVLGFWGSGVLGFWGFGALGFVGLGPQDCSRVEGCRAWGLKVSNLLNPTTKLFKTAKNLGGSPLY